jgi:hypothetical protein
MNQTEQILAEMRTAAMRRAVIPRPLPPSVLAAFREGQEARQKRQAFPATLFTIPSGACSGAPFARLVETVQRTCQCGLVELTHLLGCVTCQSRFAESEAKPDVRFRLNEMMTGLKRSLGDLFDLPVELADAPQAEAVLPVNHVMAVVLAEGFQSKQGMIVNVMQKSLENSRLHLTLAWNQKIFDPRNAPVNLALISHPGGELAGASKLEAGVGEGERYLNLELPPAALELGKSFLALSDDRVHTPFRFLLQAVSSDSPPLS